MKVETILIRVSNNNRYGEFLLSRDEETQKQVLPEFLNPQSILVAILCWSALQLERSAQDIDMT